MILVIMVGGSLVLWIAVPMGWLWIGSQVQSKADSLGTALAVMFVGSVVSIVLIARALAWLNRKHTEMREAEGEKVANPHAALERVMMVSAVIALVCFGFWFLVFAGPGPSLAPQN